MERPSCNARPHARRWQRFATLARNIDEQPQNLGAISRRFLVGAVVGRWRVDAIGPLGERDQLRLLVV
ncbi:MAG TPA: hypothetical protein VMM78_12865 [Thermomicrobiales bacterium]|nr:hypothetical protein [Thermomicrobiales bacterium]